MYRSNLLNVIKAKALKLKLWDSVIGDRLKCDSMSSIEMKVTNPIE